MTPKKLLTILPFAHFKTQAGHPGPSVGQGSYITLVLVAQPLLHSQHSTVSVLTSCPAQAHGTVTFSNCKHGSSAQNDAPGGGCGVQPAGLTLVVIVGHTTEVSWTVVHGVSVVKA